MFPVGLPILNKQGSEKDFLEPRDRIYSLRESWDSGGVAIGDSSLDLDLFNWRGWTDGNHIYLQREGLSKVHTILSDEDITEVDITFDQNMRPCIAYVANNIVKLYWYDSAEEKQVTTSYPASYKRPRVSLDDKRRFNISNSDILFFYENELGVCMRLQRERFKDEHNILPYDKNRFLWRVGMGKERRFLIHWR